jgi:hypothetical protein
MFFWGQVGQDDQVPFSGLGDFALAVGESELLHQNAG